MECLKGCTLASLRRCSASGLLAWPIFLLLRSLVQPLIIEVLCLVITSQKGLEKPLLEVLRMARCDFYNGTRAGVSSTCRVCAVSNLLNGRYVVNRM